MSKYLLLFLLLGTLAHAEDKKSCLPGKWSWIASVEGHFNFTSSKPSNLQRVEMWQQDQSSLPESKKEDRAALVLENCDAIRVGGHGPSSVELPYAASSLSKISVHEGQDLIQVVSTYSHHVNEQNTQLYLVDTSTTPAHFEKVWDAMTAEGIVGSPAILSTLSVADINHDGYADLTLKSLGEKDQTWLWNSKSHRFESFTKAKP
jgi:hypothetical protein